MQSHEEKVRRVENVLRAAGELVQRRREIERAIAEDTGLSPEGVERGFLRHAETRATSEEIDALVRGVGDADVCSVVLSANVFVAPIRALALAVATAPRVVLCPSRRDPSVAKQLVRLLADDQVTVADELDFGALGASELHVYGRNETIRSIEQRLPAHVLLRGHGAGFGAILVAPEDDRESVARAIAEDVVAFDQRGCLSPRVVVAQGDFARAEALAAALDVALTREAEVVPRGLFRDDEAAAARRFIDTMSVAGRVFQGRDHAVGLAEEGAPLLLPDPGRHVYVVPVASLERMAALLAPYHAALVAVGTLHEGRFRHAIPPHARVSVPGEMQRPRFDGPVDRRGAR